MKRDINRIILPIAIVVVGILICYLVIISVKWLPEIHREIQRFRTEYVDSVDGDSENADKHLHNTLHILLAFIQVLSAILIVLTGILGYLIYIQYRRNKLALAHLAHSIKSPVTRLRLNTDTLLEDRVSSPGDESNRIDAINRECVRLERAIRNSVINLNRGKRLMQFETLCLSEIIIDAVNAWKPVFEKAKLDFTVEYSGAKMTGRFDRVMLGIAFDNLIDNALHFSRLYKSDLPRSYDGVVVWIRKENNMGVIMIDDTGGGIPKSQQKKVFRKYHRGHDRSLTNTSGLGIGLTLARRIVRAHKGQIRVEENPSHKPHYPLEVKGSRFIIELPLLNRDELNV